MSKKFDSVPVEVDTKILSSNVSKLGKYDVLYQLWSWDGINGESLVFAAKDIAGLDDINLEKEVRKSPVVKSGSEITINRSGSGFVFVSFSFKSD